MKIRNGFVSNSSSSSFIVAIAKIVDKKKFDEAFAGIKDIVICKVKDIKNNCWFMESNTAEIKVNGFQGNAIMSRNRCELNDDDEIVAYYYCGDEGDYIFYSDRDLDHPELDYDITFDFFNREQQEIYYKFHEKNGLEYIDKSFGAGRNG